MPDEHPSQFSVLVPVPTRAHTLPGHHTLGPQVSISAAGEATTPASLLREILTTAGLEVRSSGSDAVIALRVDHGLADGERDERYQVHISSDQITLTGASAAGLSRAVQTFRQLLPAEALRYRNPAPITLECCEIDDTPRFGWRGMHLDVARHFMPVHDVLRLIDLAAFHRLNVVHLHLTDDQGWRLEIPARPRLTEVGSWRTETEIGRGDGFDGTPHGGYYTAADIREIVEFARRRGVEVVPEIDLPGHVQSVLAAYPELGNTGEAIEVRRFWGVSDHVLAPSDAALEFTRDVLDVVLDLFPSPWIHIGGDEVPRTQWRASEAAIARASELGLASVDHLQSWFLAQVHEYLTSRGRIVAGWDEILDDGGMPTDTIVTAWRGPQHAQRGLAAGHDVVVATVDHTYLDFLAEASEEEPVMQPYVSMLADITKWDPVPEQAASSPGRVLGVQGQLWSEHMRTARAVEYAAYPRLCAIAEAGWSDPQVRADSDLLDRMPGHLERLDALHVNYRPLQGPHPWQKRGTGIRLGEAPPR